MKTIVLIRISLTRPTTLWNINYGGTCILIHSGECLNIHSGESLI